MQINCETCGNDNWKIILHELRVIGITSVITALECESCGMIYPLYTAGARTSKEKIVKALQKRQ